MTVSSKMEKILQRINQNRGVLERSLDAHDTLLNELRGYEYMDERTMEDIKSRRTSTGKSAEFLSWLSSCSADVMKKVMEILKGDNQQHVVNFMECKEVDLPLSDGIRLAVFKLTPFLTTDVDAENDLLDIMRSKGALNQREYEAVKAERANTDKVNALLKIVLRKSIRSVNDLIGSLTEANQKHVADAIQTAIKGLDEAEKPKTETCSEDSNQDFSEVGVVHGKRGTMKVDGDNNVNGFDGSCPPTKLSRRTITLREEMERIIRELIKWREMFWREGIDYSGPIWREWIEQEKVLDEDIDYSGPIWRDYFEWRENFRREIELIEREIELIDREMELIDRPSKLRTQYLRGPISKTLQEQVLISDHQNSTTDLLRVLQEKFSSTESLTTLVEAILIHLKTLDTTDEVQRLFREKFRSRESLTTLVEALLIHLLNTGNESSNFDHAVNGKRSRSNTSKSTQFTTNDAFLNILKKRRIHNGTPPFRCFNDPVHNHLANLIQVG